MKDRLINRRQFIKTTATSTLFLANTGLFSLNPLYSACNADIRNNQLYGLTIQSTRPKAPLVSVYGLGYEGARSIKYLADNVGIPEVEVKKVKLPIQEGHLNFLMMDYSDLKGTDFDGMLKYYIKMANLKIAVVSVPINGLNSRTGKNLFHELMGITEIFDTVVIVPDLRSDTPQISFYKNDHFPDIFKNDGFLADTVLQIAYKMLDGGYLGPDLIDLEECFRQNAIGIVGTGIAWGSNRGELATFRAQLSLSTLANAPTDNCNWVYIVSSSSERHPFNDIENALRSVGNKLGNDADFIFGHCHRKIPDEKLHPFRVTLVATGICV